MKFTVVGAGAMGLRFGVLLQEAGNEVDFVEGDYVEVLAGPFASKSGKVESIDKEKETATVLVDFLGNITPIDMELIQLKKIEE